jgi:hypothetical protein
MLEGDEEACERFTASIIANNRDEAIEKLSGVVGENFEAEFDSLLKVEEI